MNDETQEITDKLNNALVFDEEEVDADDTDDDYEFEFFTGDGETSSPVPAEDVFLDGKIRPIFPISDQHSTSESPVRKVFVVSTEEEDVVEGPYCDWSKEITPEMSRKSNSTGFSRLWRVKDLLVRSQSDGKDAFVYLTGKINKKDVNVETTSLGEKEGIKKVKLVNVKIGEGKESKTTSFGGVEKEKEKKKKKSAYEVFYGKRENKAGKSYLPYRQELVGFFTNSSGMSRNVHPY